MHCLLFLPQKVFILRSKVSNAREDALGCGGEEQKD